MRLFLVLFLILVISCKKVIGPTGGLPALTAEPVFTINGDTVYYVNGIYYIPGCTTTNSGDFTTISGGGE